MQLSRIVQLSSQTRMVQHWKFNYLFSGYCFPSPVVIFKFTLRYKINHDKFQNAIFLQGLDIENKHKTRSNSGMPFQTRKLQPSGFSLTNAEKLVHNKECTYLKVKHVSSGYNV